MIREYLYRCQIRTATVIDESTEVAIFPRIDRIAFVLKKKKLRHLQLHIAEESNFVN